MKYKSMDSEKIKLIMEKYKNEEIYNYIIELYDLINYQKDIIRQQRIEIISFKHKESWKRYDFPEEKFKDTIDKPPKSGNMSC